MVALFFAMAAVIIISALGVVINRNTVYAALCLIANLLTVAGLFAMLDAHFLAVAQVIVYTGAIMVLFLFVIMLLNLKLESSARIGLATNILCWVLGLIFVRVLAKTLWSVMSVEKNSPLEFLAGPELQGTVKAVGHLLYTEYLFPFEASSVLLIAAIVGAVMLAKRRTGGKDLAPAKPVGR